jgi:PilZ domain
MVGTSYQDQGGRRRRKTSRRRFAYPAKLHFGRGAPSRPCIIVDISDLGARLEVPPGTDLPDEFFLLFGDHSSVQRRCRVVWRSAIRIGVLFQVETPPAPQRVPQQDSLGMVMGSQGHGATKKKRA